ncbi:MAG: rRNA maturation RNase YbeY [Hyphomicrobiales bacterium]|nr:rRNA maturation RNase YbeY [Hyphomicrobiales bacterium]
MIVENRNKLVSVLPLIEMNVVCDGWPVETRLSELTDECITSVISAAQLRLPSDAQLSLLFSDDKAIKELNNRFRGIDKATNVLSFPGSDLMPGGVAPGVLGDIAFALQTIKREAILEDKRFDHHLSHLMIHGFLHLFGYDHLEDDEARKMEHIEIAALANLGIENPYDDSQPVPDKNKE